MAMTKATGGTGGKGKAPTRQGDEERMAKTSTVRSSNGLMDHNTTPKKGKGEF